MIAIPHLPGPEEWHAKVAMHRSRFKERPGLIEPIIHLALFSLLSW